MSNTTSSDSTSTCPALIYDKPAPNRARALLGEKRKAESKQWGRANEA